MRGSERKKVFRKEWEMKKATRATFKSFIRKNRENLLVKLGSRFSGMTDMVEEVKDEFSPAETARNFHENNFGYRRVWLVGGGRDIFKRFETDELTGLNVYNACGEFWVAVKKGEEK